MSIDPPSEIGLCADCRFASVQRSERGGEFWRCQRSDTDERFPRYPPLPIRECAGYAASRPDSSDSDPHA